MLKRLTERAASAYNELVPAELTDDVSDQPQDGAATPEVAAAAVWPARPSGPFDLTECGHDQLTGRADLGCVLLRPAEGLDASLVQDAAGRYAAVQLSCAAGEVAVTVFAAPRSRPLWAGIISQAAVGDAAVIDGEFGAQLLLPGEEPTRVVGIDGPGWLLRATVHGDAATDEIRFAELLGVVRALVVRRGTDPVPAGHQLPIVFTDPDAPAHVEHRFSRLPSSAVA